jgi:adenylate kinase
VTYLMNVILDTHLMIAIPVTYLMNVIPEMRREH